MYNELISVIVPVYNVEKYIEECVESILNQTYDNLEILLIDDGSTDNSGKICDRYADKDKRIKVVHKANGGLSDARNHALKMAVGGYITFVDSDDIIDPKMIELLYKAIKEKKAELSICNYQRFAKNEEIKAVTTVEMDELGSRECMLRYFMGVKYQSSIVIACGKLYKKELWKGITYPVGMLHEDEFTTYKLIYRAKKIVYVDAPLYYYRYNPNSITGAKANIKHLNNLTAFDNYIEFFTNREDYELADKFKVVYYRIGSIYRYYELKKVLNRMQKKMIKDKLRKYNKEIFTSKYISKKSYFKLRYQLLKIIIKENIKEKIFNLKMLVCK